ncbi:aldo/keto reductase [Cellulomonas sp. P5_C5]
MLRRRRRAGLPERARRPANLEPGLSRPTSTLDDATLQAIATQHGKSPAQVMVRWHVQEGRSAIPKSTKAARIAENSDVFDFELTLDRLAAIDALDTGVRCGPPVEAITREAYAFEIPEV